MSSVGEKEAITQKRVTEFFLNTLGYRYLGFLKAEPDNANVDVGVLTGWLKSQGHDDQIIGRVFYKLNRVLALGGNRTLYDANREVYDLLRYGVKVRPNVGEQNITVWLIDWKDPQNNDFAIAEEVTIVGMNTKRPDIVLYVNGIALGVLELKRSTVSVTEGIRQNLDNQKKEFIRHFFTTMQLVMAGNDTEGLHYGVIETPEKYYQAWREESATENPLDRGLEQVCRKDRFLELIRDFIVFDAGVKKVCRHNQYFGVRAAQERVRRREGGIIWHTQGSGKSLVMVWLARWIRENMTDARVLIITDRKELDKQIEKVFKGVSESIHRTTSGADLVSVLNSKEEHLICSLIHKFGRGDELTDQDMDAFVDDIKRNLPKGFHAKGDVYVFVDECHRTQSGKLHEALKALLPGAMLIGFTGTPLLSGDKRRSIEVFGPYIHTYKYDEAVRDEVVLDLRYEARDIDQNITSQDKIDQWFSMKTAALTDLAKAQLKQRWGTMKKVLSCKERLEKIVADITMDMELRDRLKSGHGNAMLVSGSIYAACRLFEMFQHTELAGKCAIITSYTPGAGNIKGEETGEGQTEKLLKEDIYRQMLAAHFDEPEETAMHKAEQFEKEVTKRFVDEPGQMKLMIVVDKMLTGFDAPPATYLYIDKQMRDHGLFQAICRVNRIDGVDKDYGYIIDYKDLFRSLEASIHDYTGEAFDGYDKEDVAGLLEDRLGKGRERLEQRREEIKALCETVDPPCDTPAYLRYFCGAGDDGSDALKDTERRRVALYKATAAFLRAYANLANEMIQAGYSTEEAQEIKGEVTHYEKVRQEVKLASGDYIDMKVYEPAMRHLLDTYIRAEESETLSAFEDMTLVELIVENGEDAINSLPKGIQQSHEAVAETIENNVRKLIIDEMPVNPKYYGSMSRVLDALILERKKEALDYKAYLARIVALAKSVSKPEAQSQYPTSMNSSACRALYDNLEQNEELAAQIDKAVRETKKADWRGNRIKEREVFYAIKKALAGDEAVAVETFGIVKNQRDY
jgi:type I restriction enzyme, R subunit